MLLRLLSILFIVVGVALLFSFPSPFREPEYLKRRTRTIETYQNKFKNFWVEGDFNDDRENDSGYVSINREGKDSGKVFIRFNHLLPSIELSSQYNRVVHFENVNDIDGNGAGEIYFVAIRKEKCSASGFLYELKNQQWKIIDQIEQDGCCEFFPSNYVSIIKNKMYKINYHSVTGAYDLVYDGKMK